MAGTRGLAQFKGKQLNAGIMRDRHFDEANKINERFIDIDFNAHRETLEDTKIDVFSQVNDKEVAGLGKLDITSDLGGKTISTGVGVEGVVPDVRVELRQKGSEDFPFIDEDGDRVYGRITEDAGVVTLNFFSEVAGVEAPYTFAVDSSNMDFRYTLRTNMSVIPVDAIINGGSGFVEGATDANAYMNLIQLMKDVYGTSGTLDNDGNTNLVKDIVTQIADEINARTEADTEILENFASTVDGKGANLVGVEVDVNGNYVGVTVQEVLTELAARTVATENDLNDRVGKLETENEEEVFEALGGETTYSLVKGIAKPNTVLLAINGQIQAPGINFTYVKNLDGNITGFDFEPDVLEVVNGVPDVLFVQYKKVQ